MGIDMNETIEDSLRRYRDAVESMIRGSRFPYRVGQKIIDADGNIGTVAVLFDDGDICTGPDAAHPEPWEKVGQKCE